MLLRVSSRKRRQPSKTEKVEEIKIALNKLERVAGQLTSAMLNSTADATTPKFKSRFIDVERLITKTV